MRLLDSWWLDVKLGVRMLVKFPGLTFAGVIGIAVAVAIAAGGVSVVQVNMLPASLPLDESARIVSIDLWDSRANSVEPRVLHEIPAWREGLKTVQDLGAFQDLSLNLIESGVPPESVLVAAISASGLRVARVRPLLGRLLNDADERAVLIGEEVWRNRFGSSAAILGRTIQLGAGSYEIAGVMPNGFGFPVHHRFWVPLRAASVSEPLTGPAVAVFGRLAPGAAMEDAQAELAAALQRRAAERPGLYANLRPRVASYVLATLQMQGSDDMAGIVAMQGIVVGLLVLVCLNVAVLVYTRTAMRQAEIGLRTALGAPRSRIVFQLFLEALVLSAVAALAGVGIAAFALHRIAGATQHIAAELPFWISFRLSPAAVAYAGALSVLAAVIIGVVPGLQATGRELRSGPRIAGAVETGSRLGTIWSLLIIAQVGFAVALLPTAVASVVRNLPLTLAGPGFAAGEYLTARLDQFPERHTELMRQLAADPRISRATLSSSEPGDERPARIDTENAAGTVHEVKFNRVDVNFFEAFDVPVLAGRSFQPGDASAASGAVVVNEPLANELFGGNALGQRIRYAGETGGRWYEIVGVVKNFPGGVSPGMRDSQAKVYHAAAPGQLQRAVLTMRVRGAAPAFAQPLREMAVAMDPNLVLRDIRTLDESLKREQWIIRLEAAVLLGVTISVLLLASGGIYALMSFTVAQRRREIGIRIALGAGRRNIVTSIFSRALIQLGCGAVLGSGIAFALSRFVIGEGREGVYALAGVVLAVVLVGLFAALGPTRRSLRIQPTEALREQ